MDKAPHDGFTLLELLITLSIVAILLVMGVPYLRDIIQTQKIKNSISDYQMSLAYARSEAIKRSGNVDIVPSAGGWSGGWTVQAGGAVLKSMDARPDVTFSVPGGTITFQANGRPAATVSAFNAYIADNTGVAMRCVTVGVSGMAHVKIDGDADPNNGCN
ncbi:MAG: GspH/FimT family pseudopilin [Magnetococcales bacterium]|nr:GspH/FimT family pseudopilin [Magnetococcales bacterium]